MSLDGFIAGPNITPDLPMGENGLKLHKWLFDGKTDIDSQVINETVSTSGAVITGWGTYNIAIDHAWNGTSPFDVPAFVLSHHVPKKLIKGFSFVTNGMNSAVEQAKAAAGDKNVWVMGGANVIQQFLKARLFDELQLHMVPLLLSNGTRLFEAHGNQLELEKIKTIDTSTATHFKFRKQNSV